MESISIRRPVAAAIAWSVISQIIQQHGGADDLRVIEMHPSGGQADVLGLFRASAADASAYDPGSIHIGDFNLKSGRMSGWLPEGDENIDWLGLWLGNDDTDMVTDVAVQTMGLSIAKMPLPLSRRMFGPTLLATLLASEIMKIDYLDTRMGFEDTSGFGGGVRRELRQFKSVFVEEGNELRSAADCWLLFSGWQQKLLGVIRMDGLVSAVDSPDTALDLFSTYERTKSMCLTVVEARKLLLV